MVITSKEPAIEPKKASGAQSPSVDINSVLVGAGFGCFLACFMIFVGSSLMSANASESLFEQLVLRLVCLVALALMQFFSYFNLVEKITARSTSKRLVSIVILLAVPLFLIVFMELKTGIILPIAVKGAAWALLGISLGTLFLSWGNAWNSTDSERADNKTSAIILCVSVFFAGLLCLSVAYAPQVVALLLTGVIYIASSFSQLFVSTQYQKPVAIGSETKQKEILYSYLAMLTPGISYFSTAVIVCIVLTHYGSNATLLVFLTSAASAGCLMLLAIWRGAHVPRMSTVERVCIPIIAACAIVGCMLLAFGIVIPIFLLYVMLTCTVCYAISHWNVIVVLSYRHDVLPLSHFAKGLIAPLCGFAIGWAMQVILLSICGELMFLVLIPFSLIVLIMIVSTSLMPYKENKRVEAISGLSQTAKESQIKDLTRYWYEACARVSNEYKLSLRETEVFELLAKGRNTEHIHQELFISIHTVKTHSQRIYRKLNINSQQDLISIVEEERKRFRA